MELPRLDGAAQRLARTEDVLLADDFLQGSRPHPVGERPRRIGSASVGCAHSELIWQGFQSRPLRQVA